MPSMGYSISSFALPVICFLLWNILFFSYLPVLEIDLDFSRQIVLADLYLSNIILILTWFLCGQIVFIVFASFFSLLVLYLMLNIGDFGIGVQILTILLLYIWLKHITGKIEDEKLDEVMQRDRMQEEVNLSQKQIDEKELLLSALNQKRDRLKYLREISDHLKGASELESAGHVVTKEVSELIPEADQVLLYIREEDSEELGMIAISCVSEEHHSKEKKGNEYDQWVVKRSQPLLVEDAQTDFRFMSDAKQTFPYRSICAVPLLSKNKVRGVLRLGSKEPNVFQTDDMRLLDIVADLAAVTLHNISLFEKTRDLAIIDSLTECYLLRHVQERLIEEIQRSIRNKASFCVLMADIDHFKSYNDNYGHTAGDHVLRKVSDIIKKTVGSSNIVGRYGGEEFIVVLPQKDLEQGVAMAERIRHLIENLQIDLKDQKCNLTISVGVAQFPNDGTSKEELIAEADNRLYKAKKTGRNRVCGSI